jgi:hypothetical protein
LTIQQLLEPDMNPSAQTNVVVVHPVRWYDAIEVIGELGARVFLSIWRHLCVP